MAVQNVWTDDHSRRSYRHIGQTLLTLSHFLRQARWKMCPHSILRMSWFGWKPSMQMAHCLELFFMIIVLIFGSIFSIGCWAITWHDISLIMKKNYKLLAWTSLYIEISLFIMYTHRISQIWSDYRTNMDTILNLKNDKVIKSIYGITIK